MFNNFMNKFQRDIEYGGGSALETPKLLRHEYPVTEGVWNMMNHPSEAPKQIDFEYPLPLEEWLKEFKIGTKINNDSKTETLLKELFEETKKKEKELIIRNSQRYCRLNHTTKTL